MLSKVLIGVIITLGLSFTVYYKTTQDRLVTLQENNAKLEVAVATSEQSIATLKDAAEQFQTLNKQLTSDLQKAEAYRDELQATLRKHNLTMLAIEKPGLIEKRMNDATEKLWDSFTDDTTVSVQPVDTGAGDTSSN